MKMKKILLIAFILRTAAAMTAYGAGLSDDPAALLVPTLTELNATDSVTYPRPSAYALEVALTSGSYTITKYLNNLDGTVSPVLYNLLLNDAGDSATPSDNNYYFKWTDTPSGKQLTAGAAGAADLNVYPTSGAAGYYVGHTNTNTAGNALGGALVNVTMGNIDGDFINNTVVASSAAAGASAQGGVYYGRTGGGIGDITGNFIGNSATVTDSPGTLFAQGGAIYKLGRP